MFEIGQEVKVLVKRECNDPKKETWETLHRGFVVELTSHFARIFNPRADNGDTTIDCSQWYAMDAKRQKIQLV